MARPERSSELRATLPGSMGTRGHEMSKRERGKRNRPQGAEYKHVVNVRHLQNGIGIAGALAIVSMFAYLALDPGPDSAPSAVTNRPSGPEATNGNTFPAGATNNLSPSLAPLSVSPAPSSLSASPTSPMSSNDRVASPSARSTSTSVGSMATNTAGTLGATTQPHVAAPSRTTPSIPLLGTTLSSTTAPASPTTTTTKRQRQRQRPRRRRLPERLRAPQ